MTPFTDDDVRRLARLARLQLDVDEIERFSRQLGDILDFARQVQAIDTSSVSDTEVVGAAMPLREDTPAPSLRRGDVLESANEHDPISGLIKVPRVIGS